VPALLLKCPTDGTAMMEDLYDLYDYLEREATDEVIAACRALIAVMKKHRELGACDADSCRLIANHIESMGAFLTSPYGRKIDP
jgi:hypothetical protein